MAYVKSNTITLAGSVSFQPNNLSYCSDYAVCLSHLNTLLMNFAAQCYVRFNEVVLISVDSGEARKMPISTKAVIYQAAIVNVTSTLFLVITSSEGTQIWSVDGLELKFFLPLNSLSSSNSESYFSRGIAGTSNGYICTGTSGGTVVLLNIPSRGGEGISFFDSLETRDCPILSLASSEILIAAGNDNGDIYCFDPNESFLKQCMFHGVGFPCTAIAGKEDTIVAGFSSGHIRVYNFFQKQQLVEVTAHARAITGISMHPDLYLAASCSEDQHMHVWSVPDMSILSVNVVDNKKLTGVSFMIGDRVGVVAYDDDEITVFNRT